ncbi:GMP synthase (glutamine-hydrolysing) [Anseongella ginsenosidimutans]|uniref:GMP synthase (Glutamine-hydrolysing) n=1 Tax=Anseongella ginsenosidimutans TaxID=496056 RepID=A0A4V2UU32_9SPHI|nr:type 1 glutamine amidotransferase [Anseongella ginsenosidimutans]QEC51542.1 type 1 glutamine amidotransferase [Anseongella ginsenosidimutans]TCS88863.1 GMP synthase (glutamine-hydrolysing) [Anseongella ginsenosidimutans]
MHSEHLRIHYFQHVPFEGPGSIAEWAQQKGHSLTRTRFYEQEALPALDGIDWLVIMGGPMSAHDEGCYPWMAPEKAFIRQAISAGKTVIGICLGAQLIAQVLGARVYPNPQKEIGWFPVTFSGREASGPDAGGLAAGGLAALTVFHWHGDTFDLPENCRRIASSEACRNQGFWYTDCVLGLQFHCEVNRAALEEMVKEGVEEFRTVEITAGEAAPAAGNAAATAGRFIQTPAQILSGNEFILPANRYLEQLLEQLAAGQGRIKAR